MIQDNNLSDPDTINEIDSFLKEAESVYNTIKEDVDNLETVFEEYGYRYNKNIVNETSYVLQLNQLYYFSYKILLFIRLFLFYFYFLFFRKSKETSTTSDLNGSDDMQEIVFTPDLGWRCKKKSIDKTSLINGDSYLSEESAILKKIADIAMYVFKFNL